MSRGLVTVTIPVEDAPEKEKTQYSQNTKDSTKRKLQCN